jgi:hypothetical protein
MCDDFLQLSLMGRHYQGFLEDGTCLDDSFQRGQPIFFVLGGEQVLKGWEMVIPILSRGERARITLPAEVTPYVIPRMTVQFTNLLVDCTQPFAQLAYGDKGYPPIIPPKAVLTFELELLTFSSMGHAERKTREKKEREKLLLEQRQAASAPK